MQFGSRGLDQLTHEEVAAGITGCPAALRLVVSGGEGRMLVATKPDDFIGLPQAHPPVRTFIACRVATRDAALGWMYAADRLGDESFTADDERLLVAVGAQLATGWQSMMVVEELDQRVADRTRELQAANAGLEAFSSLVSHDLRSPLGNIGGFAVALADKFAAGLPPDAVRYLRKIEQNVQIMTTLIDDLLNFARASKAGIELLPADLSLAVQQCLDKFQDEISRRGVKVVTAPMPLCRFDAALMGQVLYNLIGNALKYTGGQSSPVIEIGARRDPGELIVFVRDNGTGFDMEFAHKLFKPFARLHSAAQFPGSGIGLALVEQVVSRHGGRVWAESTPGEGACFYFTLPLE